MKITFVKQFPITIPHVFYCIKPVFCYPMDFWFVWVLIAYVFPLTVKDLVRDMMGTLLLLVH